MIKQKDSLNLESMEKYIFMNLDLGISKGKVTEILFFL